MKRAALLIVLLSIAVVCVTALNKQEQKAQRLEAKMALKAQGLAAKMAKITAMKEAKDNAIQEMKAARDVRKNELKFFRQCIREGKKKCRDAFYAGELASKAALQECRANLLEDCNPVAKFEGGDVCPIDRGEDTGFGGGENFSGFDMASHPNGFFVAYYESYNVYGQVYDPKGNMVGDRFRIGGTSGFGEKIHVAALKNGDFVATWAHPVGSGSSYQLHFAIFKAEGKNVARVADGTISSFAGKDTYDHDVAALPNGGFTVFWVENWYDLKGRRFDKSGVMEDDLLTVGANYGQGVKPRLTALDDGTIVLVTTHGNRGMIWRIQPGQTVGDMGGFSYSQTYRHPHIQVGDHDVAYICQSDNFCMIVIAYTETFDLTLGTRPVHEVRLQFASPKSFSPWGGPETIASYTGDKVQPRISGIADNSEFLVTWNSEEHLYGVQRKIAMPGGYTHEPFEIHSEELKTVEGHAVTGHRTGAAVAYRFNLTPGRVKPYIACD